MPQLRPGAMEAPAAATIKFVVSPGLDVLNALYFTFLAGEYEGVGAWPIETHARLDAGLRDELNALYTYPRGEPGIMGALTDVVFSRRETWGSVEAVLDFMRGLPAGGTADPHDSGIRGLAMHALRWPCDADGYPAGPMIAQPSRDSFAEIVATGDVDLDKSLALYDDPEQVRARVMRLIRRFYDEHYRHDEQRRIPIMQRSVESRRGQERDDPQAVLDSLTQRHISCIEEAGEPYTTFIFAPSVDVGAYLSCTDTPPVHGVFYPAEAATLDTEDPDERAERMALVYKALADPQRLRILRLLGDRELYVQEIVERTGISQSVVSRHLSFMKAVGLVSPRRQNNMKFFSINRQMRHELRAAVDALMPPA